MSKTLSVRLFFVLLLSGIIIFLPGCAKSGNSGEEPPVYSPARVLTPEAPGTQTLGSSPLVLDISNQDQGYLTAQSDSEDSRMSIQLTTPSGVLYSYFLEPEEQAVIPFSEGSGDYVITCYQQIDGSQYAALYSETLTVKLENEFLPFLYPNQYVNFSAESEACTLAQSLVTDEMKDVDILKTFYNYVTSHIQIFKFQLLVAYSTAEITALKRCPDRPLPILPDVIHPRTKPQHFHPVFFKHLKPFFVVKDSLEIDQHCKWLSDLIQPL